MDRRTLVLSGLASLGASACATMQPAGPGNDRNAPNGSQPPQTYTMDDIVAQGSDFLGVAAESMGAAAERVFAEYGQPTGYIAGEEAAAAITVGLRYGQGLLYMKQKPTTTVFWQGPS